MLPSIVTPAVTSGPASGLDDGAGELSEWATRLPAADPRPGPTGMPCSRAYRMKSQVIRKYPGYFICLIIAISYERRASYSASV